MISNQPIVLIGPGSEWFWSMAQFVVVAITLVGIYSQFRLQRATNAFEQLNRILADWESEPMLRARLEVARTVADGTEAPEGALGLIGNHWETVGTLVRQGHIDERVVSESIGNNATVWWTAIAAGTRDLREERLDPTIFENFEWLEARCAAAGAKAGAPLDYDRAALERIYAASIPGLLERIRIVEESRMVPERRARRSGRSDGAG